MNDGPNDQELAARYAAMRKPELMELARDYDNLLEPAQALLRGEFARRGLEPPLLDERVEPDEASLRLVTVQRIRDLSEAIVARSLLESAGIEVYLFDENFVRLDWQMSNFVGGMRLQVKAGDEAEARAILAQPVPESFAAGTAGEFDQPRCPVCGSAEITFAGKSRGAAITALFLFSLPLPLGRETWVCSRCGTRWENTTERP
jgi:hypothetical protein